MLHTQPDIDVMRRGEAAYLEENTVTTPSKPAATARRWSRAAAAVIGIGALFATCVGGPAAADTLDPADQQYRPLVHFSPEENWMNDPNGMVYVDGTYHLFFQHNPQDTDWGNMSWGHATSTDLLTWTQHGVAIPQTFNDDGVAIEDIFSGSVVVDENNTSGFGTEGGPAPLVAIYTSAYTDAHPSLAGIQAQSLAYSNDNGETWTKYEANPVLDRGSANFRDPKVFWYEGETESYWVMVAVEATDHKVVLYRSDDLRGWDYLSEFGNANSVAGIWECPDLFELPVDGDENNTKWVLIVNLNPGAVAGGSGGQYFVGEFDGVTFTSESTVAGDTVPAGTRFEDFESGFDGWSVGNEPGNWKDGPWGSAPATGTLEGQSPVSGFIGEHLVNGFHDGDWPVGTLTSDEFTISAPYVNLLVGGGRHPHVEGTRLSNDPPEGTTLFDFELPAGQNLADSGWTLTGDFTADRNPSTAGGEYYLGDKRINTWEGGPKGDDNVGTLTSPEFTIDADYLSMLIGGGRRTDGSLQAELLVDGQSVRTATGKDAGALNWQHWDVSDLQGSTAQLRIVDEATGGWGHLTFDHLVMSDEPAAERSAETSVNLIVDGTIVRSATGNDSESLDWASWNVAEYEGKTAQIQLIDNNRGSWGHLLLDQVMFADEPALTRLESYDWLDWGRDYYASVSYSGTSDPASRIMQGWMSNWDYATSIPTSTWRSSMALPREVSLVTTDRGPRLTQRVVDQVSDQLDTAKAKRLTDVQLDGSTELGLGGEVVRVDVVLDPGTAQRSGIRVFGNETSGTLIGYDTESGRVFVDRRDSGNVDFHPSFASVEDVPITLADDGTVSFEIYLDRASVELFTDDGLVTITDQVFPDEGADDISGFAEGGTAALRSITVTPMVPTMWAVPAPHDGSTSAPATGALSHDNGWDTGLLDGDYTITMNLWWGSNASEFRLYEDGVLISTQPLTYAGNSAQQAKVKVTGKPNGAYVYTGELVNSTGTTATSPVTVSVTQANPGTPALSHDNWDRDGSFTLTANLWWGTNATSYTFYEGDQAIASGELTAKTPAAQAARHQLTGVTSGTHTYRVEFINAAGSTFSAPVTVVVAG